MKEAKRNAQELINQYLFRTYGVDKSTNKMRKEKITSGS